MSAAPHNSVSGSLAVKPGVIPVLSLPQWAGVGLALLVYFALCLPIGLSKRPWADEGWFASPSLNLAEKGVMGTTTMETSGTPLLRIEQHTYWVAPLYLVTQAAWFKVVPFSLFADRLPSILWGAVALLAMFLLVFRITGHVAPAWLALGLLAVDYNMIDRATEGRPEMMTVALGLLAIAVYLSLRERNFLWALFAGNVWMACAFVTHPNFILHWLALCLLILWLDRPQLKTLPKFFSAVAVCALPYLVAGAGWLLYIMKDPAAFRSQITFNAVQGGRFLGLQHPLLALKLEWTDRYRTAFGLGEHSSGHTGPIFLKSLVLLAYVVSILLVLGLPKLRRQKGAVLLLALLGTYFLGQSLFNQKVTMYLVHIVPLYTAVLAFAGWALWKERILPRGLIVLGLAGVVMVQAGATLYRSRLNERKPHAEMVAFVNAQRKPGDFIFGSAALGFDFGFDGQVLDDPRIGALSGKRAQFIVVDDIYRDYFRSIGKRDGALVAHMQQILEREYQLAYQQNAYSIYIHRN
ncbi:MAG: glycosyltransferase family 39 protein [Acidobacteria bacterium]|nr:glycosyltransferase family 39 protein [Acidobacteriota bacterium]